MQKLLLALLILGACSCHTTRKAAVLGPGGPGLPALPESNINVPVKIYMASFLKKASGMIPKEVTSEGWPNFLQTSCDFHYKYRFVPGSFSFNCANNDILVKLNGTYQVWGEKCICAFGKQSTPWVGGSCGFGSQPMRKTEILIHSSLQFQPNYTVRSRTLTQRVNALEKCTVSLFNLDVTQQVMDSIRSSTNAFCFSMDSTVNSMDFSANTKSLGERINKKIPLGRYGFLKLNPSAVKIGKMNYTNDTLQTTMGISCFPELHSDSTNNYSAAFLPPLQTAEVPAGITVYTNARYDYGFINRLMNSLVRDSSFEVEGRTVIIRNIQITGSDNGKVELTLDFDGDKNGSLFLTGTPRLDTAAQVIDMPDLEYSLNSNDLALNLGKTLFGNKILRTLREKASIHIRDMVEKNRASIDAQLNKKITDGVFSSGSLTDLRVLALVIGREALQAQTCARAKASIIITKL
jgi:hypothetical protein